MPLVSTEMLPDKVTLPFTVMPLVAPVMLPETVNGLAETFVTSKLPVTVIGAEIVSPMLVDNCMSKAGLGVLLSVRVPPLPVTLKDAAPPEAPMFNAPMVVAPFKSMVWFAAMAELTVATDCKPLGNNG